MGNEPFLDKNTKNEIDRLLSNVMFIITYMYHPCFASSFPQIMQDSTGKLLINKRTNHWNFIRKQKTCLYKFIIPMQGQKGAIEFQKAIIEGNLEEAKVNLQASYDGLIVDINRTFKNFGWKKLTESANDKLPSETKTLINRRERLKRERDPSVSRKIEL